MKKFLFLTLALSAAFFAKADAKEDLKNIDIKEFVTIKVAEKTELQMAALTLGTMSGNPLVGGFLANQAAQFDPAAEGVEVDPTLKNGEIARAVFDAGLFDKIFACKDTLKPYIGSAKSAEVTYVVTKAGIDLKAVIELNDEVKAKVAEGKTFNTSSLASLPEETLAFVFAGNEEVKLVTVDVKKELDKLKALDDKKEEIDWEKKSDVISKKLSKQHGKDIALAFKGFKPAKKVSERFEATFPEYKNAELKFIGFGSLYSLTKTLLPVYISVLDDPDEKTMMTMFMMQLPEEGIGGISMVVMAREDGKLFAHYRISADEVKSIVGAGNAFFMMAMMNGGMNGGMFEEDDSADTLIDDEDLELED